MSNDAADATRAHIDAETLAAWAEQRLAAEVATAVELHLSNCERCQEVLAAFVRSEPAPVAAVVPFWSRRPVKWGTAGLAAAAAIVTIIWVGQPSLPSPETTVARAPIDAVMPQAPPPAPPPASVTQAAESKAASPSQAQEVRAPRPASTPPARADAGKAAIQPAPVAAPPVVTSPAVTVGAAAPAGAPPPPAAQTMARTASRAESSLRDASAVLEIIAPDPSSGLAARTSADPARGAGRGGAAGAPAAFQAAVATRWRVVAGLRIERSSDAGQTWVAMPVKPALTTPIVAGDATSQFVCWFAGANGLVLVTTDGQTLRRVPIPEAVLLVSVAAENGSRAVVISADGRKFSTLDGGLTWKQEAGS